MVEHPQQSGSRFSWATFAWITVLAAFVLLWFGAQWAISGAEESPTAREHLAIVRTAAILLLMTTATVGGALWLRGRRRAEDEAEAAGQSIRDAQDAFDAQPRPILLGLIYGSSMLFMLALLAPRLIAAMEADHDAKAFVAGAALCVGGAGVSLWFWRALSGAIAAIRG